MSRGGGRELISSMRSWALVGLVASLSLAALLTAGAARADGPFEPNNDINEAAGPLLSDQPLVAAFETESDRDVYFFYVGAAEGAEARLTVANTGGGANPLVQIDARVVNAERTDVGGNFTNIRPGEARTETLALRPGKYFVELTVLNGAGSYEMLPGSNDGGFVAYAPIASRCATATARMTALQNQLRKLEAKLQRAISRLRRSRYSGPQARGKAQSLYRTAKARVRNKHPEIRKAAAAKRPWCYIPE